MPQVSYQLAHLRLGRPRTISGMWETRKQTNPKSCKCQGGRRFSVEQSSNILGDDLQVPAVRFRGVHNQG